VSNVRDEIGIGKGRTIEDLMREKGEKVRRGVIVRRHEDEGEDGDTIEWYPDPEVEHEVKADAVTK